MENFFPGQKFDNQSLFVFNERNDLHAHMLYLDVSMDDKYKA